MHIVDYADLILTGYTDDEIQKMLGYTDEQYTAMLEGYGMSEDDDPDDDRTGLTWTKEEEDYLRKEYLISRVVDIADVLHRSIGDVSDKVRELQLHRPPKWIKEEDDYIRRWYKHKTDTQLAYELMRRVNDVRNRRIFLGLKNFSRTTKRDVDID